MNVLDAIRLAERWVDAWNARNLAALLALYADDAEFHSPFVTLLASVSAPALRGRAALEAHFKATWTIGPREKMALEDVRLTEGGITLYVRGGSVPRMEIEFRLDDGGLIAWSRSLRTQDVPTPKAS